MTKFVTNASSATWWPKLEPMLIALHVGQISFSQDYFKLLSVRKLIQVGMLYPGSVVPLAMFIFVFPIFYSLVARLRPGKLHKRDHIVVVPLG